MIQVKGVNGQVEFDGTTLTIHREGFLARASVGRGTKRIPVGSIVAVQWKPPSFGTNGFVQFETAGMGGTRSKYGQQAKDASTDENSVMVKKSMVPAFDELRAAVEQAMAGQAQGGQVSASPADELTKLAALVGQGLLSREEFDAAKARLLS
ncbi:MAG TPA: DUF4429 domain-containing protein [Micromonosporaceae bacterium]|nr:DUF4429 domain-containing protein [Micromonosporaceae bacterium]